MPSLVPTSGLEARDMFMSPTVRANSYYNVGDPRLNRGVDNAEEESSIQNLNSLYPLSLQQTQPQKQPLPTQTPLNRAKFLLSHGKVLEALELFDSISGENRYDVEALNGKGNCLQKLGLLEDALRCFRSVVCIDRFNIDALFHCGIILKIWNRTQESITIFERALSLASSNSSSFRDDIISNLSQALTDRGTELKLSGDSISAVRFYLQTIQLAPSYAPAYYNLGVIYSERGNYVEALKYYETAIKHNGSYVECYCNCGVIHKSQGNLEGAIQYYAKALSINPNFEIARNNMAVALVDYGTQLKLSGKIQDSIQCYKKALSFNFKYGDAYYNLGVVYGEQWKYSDAIVSYELATYFHPNCCEAYNNLGVIYKDLDNLEKSLECYQRALTIRPNFVQALNNIGVLYTVQGKMEEAIMYLEKAILVNPTYSEAYNNLGVLFRDQGDIEDAVACYDKSLECSPISRNAAQNRLMALNYLERMDINVLYTAHMEWGLRFTKYIREQSPAFEEITSLSTNTNRVLRIGYLSADFFTHSVSYFIEGLLIHHNPEKTHIICYSNVVRGDMTTERLKKVAHRWRDIQKLSTSEAANLIREDKIDILVELSGHTSGNRLDIMALRPAPIQITYIGYPNTTGLKSIDYRITDAVCDPLNTKQQYVEKLVRMPKCFLCYTPSLHIPEPVLPCLTNGFITFGSFNNLAKIHEGVISLWCTVLNAVPGSRMVIKCKPFASPSIQQRMFKKFEVWGIDSSRIDLLGLTPSHSEHLNSYGLMDLSLDTFPYAGTTTTCESLWMGVPVITLKGKTHCHNVGVSLLTAIGFQELICNSKKEYVEKAIELSTNLIQLQMLKRNLRPKMKETICDATRFTADLELLYQQLWKRKVDTSSQTPKETDSTKN